MIARIIKAAVADLVIVDATLAAVVDVFHEGAEQVGRNGGAGDGRVNVEDAAAVSADDRRSAGAERRVEESHLVDQSAGKVGAQAVELAAADDGGAGGLPAAAVGDAGLKDAVDIEQQFAIDHVIDADEVVPDAGGWGGGGVGMVDLGGGAVGGEAGEGEFAGIGAELEGEARDVDAVDGGEGLRAG